MSTVFPYRISLETLKTARGSLSTETVSKIVDNAEKQCQLLDSEFEEEYGWLPAKQLLSDFLSGSDLSFSGNTSKHWHIVELLCRGFGTALSNDNWQYASLDDFYDYNEFRMYFLGLDPLVRIASPDDFPLVFTVENKDFEKVISLISTSPRTSNQMEEFYNWIKSAQNAEQDLILFAY